MPINLLISPPASGKTHYCISRALEVKQNSPLAPVWIIVPDGYHAHSIRKQIAKAGGALGIQVLTPGSLYKEILETVSRPVPLAPPALLQQLTHKAIQELLGNGAIKFFKDICQTPGFVRAMLRRFEELKRGLVLPETFLEQADTPPLKEIAALYAKYQELLLEIEWADPEGWGWLALEYFPETIPWPLVIFDGFDSFTTPELRLIESLSSAVPEIIVSLPGEREMSRNTHNRFEDTLQKLERLPDIKFIDHTPYPHLSDELLHLEQHLDQAGSSQIGAQDRIIFLEARSPADECREALRWLKGLILRDGVEYSDCAIISPNPSNYRPHLEALGEEFGLQLHFGGNLPLDQSPLFSSLRNLLRLDIEDYPRRRVIDAVRSPYFNFSKMGIETQDGRLLDLVSQDQNIIGQKEIWLDGLKRLSERKPRAKKEEELTTPTLPLGKDANNLLQAFAQFTNALTPKEQKQSLTSWITWLEDLLEEIDLFAQITFEADKNALTALRQILRELVLAEQIVGLSDIDYPEFLLTLQEAAARQSIPEPSMLHKNAISILRLTEGRGLRHSAVAILGLSEGIFPRPQRADPFLNEEIREQLGIESALDPHQLSLFYLAVSRADKKLLLTRPYLAPDGEVWQPSPYWDSALALFETRVAHIQSDSPQANYQAGSSQEALTWAMQRGKILPSLEKDYANRVNHLRTSREIIRTRLSPSAESIYEGNLSELSDELKERFGPDHVWSASRFESYTSCPHRFFTSSILGLETAAEVELGMDVAQRGSLLHRILERTYQEAPDPTDLESLGKTLQTVAKEEFGASPKTEGFRPTPLWETEQQELLKRLENTIEELHKISAGWNPTHHEAAFGLKHGGEKLQIDIDGTAVYLRGLIDRVDENANGELRIIDYKTGSSGLSNKDLESGKRLQLPLYALAARDALQLGTPVEGFYWAINQAKAGALKLSKYGVEGSIQTVKEHIAAALEGIQGGEFPPIPPEGGCPDYCPATAWCYRYTPGRSFK